MTIGQALIVHFIRGIYEDSFPPFTVHWHTPRRHNHYLTLPLSHSPTGPLQFSSVQFTTYLCLLRVSVRDTDT